MKKTLLSILIISVFVTIIALPVDTKAITLQEYEQKVEQYAQELEDKNNDINVSKKKLEEIKNKITEYENQITKAEEEVNALQEEIDRSNKEIEKKTEESKSIIEYYQITNGENIYLEYAFGATDITDMIYRMSIVEQLTEYNDKIMNELQALIDSNKQKQLELKQKQEELTELNKKLAAESSKVQGNITAMEGLVPNIKGQLSYYKGRVEYYKSVGCTSSDVIGVDCDVPKAVTSGSYASGIAGANGFVFPVSGSYRLSTNFYWNGSSGHKGLDIVQYCGAPIKAVANGRVYYVGNNKDTYGAKMIMIVHNYNGRLVFSQYAHLNGYAVSEGEDVAAGQTIGYMGSTGWSSGCHLHLEMSETKGWDYPDPGNYWSYIKYIVSPYKYIPR